MSAVQREEDIAQLLRSSPDPRRTMVVLYFDVRNPEDGARQYVEQCRREFNSLPSQTGGSPVVYVYNYPDNIDDTLQTQCGVADVPHYVFLRGSPLNARRPLDKYAGGVDPSFWARFNKQIAAINSL